MTNRFTAGVRRLSIFCGVVASCIYGAWAGLSLAIESDSFQHDVLWLLMWWAGGLVVCFFAVWGIVRAIGWVVAGFMKTNGVQ